MNKVIDIPDSHGQYEKVDIFTVGDMIDKAIVHLADGKELGKLSLQKGVFLYLLSLSTKRNYDFKKVANLAGFEPYKFGPFSEFLEGELEQLKGYKEVQISGTNEEKVKSFQESSAKYKLKEDEMEILANVKFLIENLTPTELAFYVYFNPAIDEDVREYFTSNSEIKEKLKNERMKYVRSLKNKNIIDDEAADLIIYG
ncbi:MAG: hypothetical protein ACYCSA_04850 [Thermoplasmataceae archaeon]